MNSLWTPMVEVVPEGKSGTVVVDHVTVSLDAARWASVRGELLSPGPLARLKIDGQLVMSDGDMEHATNQGPVRGAHGDVLVAGLGLGMVLVPMLRNPRVKSVLVLEKSLDVIRLVEPALCRYVGDEAASKLEVKEADCFVWKPHPNAKIAKWDWIYFDVWPTICTDNLKGIAQLKRRYARRLNRENPRAWMGAWVEDQLRRQRRRDDQERKGGRVPWSYPDFRCGTFR